MVEMLEFLDHSKKSHPSHLQTTKEVLELSIHLFFKIQEHPCYLKIARWQPRENYIFSVESGLFGDLFLDFTFLGDLSRCIS